MRGPIAFLICALIVDQHLQVIFGDLSWTCNRFDINLMSMKLLYF